MSLIRINRNPSRGDLAVFGLLWLVFFGLAGAILRKKGVPLPWSVGVWGAGGAVALAGLVVPGLMRRVYVGMAYAAFPVGMVVSYTLLLCVYYLVLTPTGLVMRLLGYDTMGRRFDRGATTYWCERRNADTIDRYFKQF